MSPAAAVCIGFFGAFALAVVGSLAVIAYYDRRTR